MPVAADNQFDPAYNVASHGFAQWNVLNRTGVNSHALAQADALANYRRLALCSEVIDANNYRALDLFGCRVELESAHGLGATFGQDVYLSRTVAGAMTTTKPTGAGEVVYLGWTVDANTIHFIGYERTQILA